MAKKYRHEEAHPDAVVHYEPQRKHRRPPKKSMQPPLTPMIDVTFQLLLFFLLTMQFREAEGRVPGNLPPIGEGSVGPTKEVKLVIRRVGGGVEYYIGRQPVGIDSPAQLRQSLVAARRKIQSDETPLVIEPQFKVPWEYVAEAFSQAVNAKFKKIGFGAISQGSG